jgi:hypothetical protein
MILSTGAMVVKILRRNVNLSVPVFKERPGLIEHDIPIPIPKKTRLYLEIAMKEQRNATGVGLEIMFTSFFFLKKIISFRYQ